MEKFDLRRPSSQAKSVGIIMAVSGPFVMTLYKRPPLLMASSPSNLPHRLLLSQQQPNWVLGGFFLGVSCISSSIWNIAQTTNVEEYPDQITVVFSTASLALSSVQFSLSSVQTNPTDWILQPGIEMIAFVFSAIYGTVFQKTALTWCWHKKGPVFVAMFKPTIMVIAVVFELIFLSNPL